MKTVDGRKSQYFASSPTVKSDRRSVFVDFNGKKYEFITDAGVFSKNGADFGSMLLVDAFIKQFEKNLVDRTVSNIKLLDLGCGYGLIGVIVMGNCPQIQVLGCDINERAVELAALNAEINRVKYEKVLVSDIASSIEDKFQIVLTNPPVRAGKDVVIEFYKQSFEKLESGGQLFVVLQKKQGAESTERKLREIFGNCIVIARDAGYRVMLSLKE